MKEARSGNRIYGGSFVNRNDYIDYENPRRAFEEVPLSHLFKAPNGKDIMKRIIFEVTKGTQDFPRVRLTFSFSFPFTFVFSWV